MSVEASQSGADVGPLADSGPFLWLDRPLSSGLCIIFAGVYATILCMLPVYTFLDRLNYQNYAENSAQIFGALWDLSPAAALFNEPIWLLLNSALALALPADAVIRTIVFASAFAVAYPMFRLSGRHWPLVFVFLTFPSVIKNHIIHLRQGLAIGIFMIFYRLRWPRGRWLGVAIAVFVHTSFFFVALIMLMELQLRRLRLAIDVRTFSYIAAGLFVSLGLGLIAAIVGARQVAVYEFSASSGSGAGFAFWSVIAGLYLTAGQNFTRNNSFAIGAILFYLATYFFLEVTARIFESMLPIVLLSSTQLPPGSRMFFIAAFLTFTILLWISRAGQPAFGF